MFLYKDKRHAEEWMQPSSWQAQPSSLISQVATLQVDLAPGYTCSDSPSASSPNCGWAKNSQTGANIVNSQGFCCSCTFWQSVQGTWNEIVGGNKVSE